MRDKTIKQAQDEIQVLDSVSVALRQALRSNYDSLQSANPARKQGYEGDIEIAAAIHNNRVGLTEALEEVARRGYGRVVFVREEDETGKLTRHSVYRVSQANAGLPEPGIRIIERNSRLGSQIASCRIGDDLEVRTPSGERSLLVTDLIDLEGATQLLRTRPDIKLARFYVSDDPVVDVVRNVRLFLESLSTPPEPLALPQQQVVEREEVVAKPSDVFWPTDWSKVIFADEPEAALGAQFFTRTTQKQEDAIRTVRGVTMVHGIAGTGKTSVALGRLKFFANFRSGEHLEDYGLSRADWADFDSSDMIGFVLNPSLVQYLKQTAEELELRMKIMDFEEFRNQERQSRRVFGRPYKRSQDRNPYIQRDVRWLAVLAEIMSLQLAEGIEAIGLEELAKPDTPDGSRISEMRWRDFADQFWKTGPLRGRIVGLIRRLKDRVGGLAALGRIQGIASSIDRDIRLSDAETTALSTGERRAIREAVLNISLRFFRLLNPSELYAAAHSHPSLSQALKRSFPEQFDQAQKAAKNTAALLDDRTVTDDDVVSALCVNALTCDQFERDIRDIPYLVTFSDRVAVFIDEYQDFSEQQLFLMGFRAKAKYRQITVAGDVSQRLHRDGVVKLADAFPYIGSTVRQVALDTNFRQTAPLARLSNSFRAFTEGAEQVDLEPCGAPIHLYDETEEIADVIVSKISSLPGEASVVIIAPTADAVRNWFDVMASSLESSFRSPIISDRARLTERLKTHFTIPLEAKGLEFDVAIIPDLSGFDDADLIALNALYVSVSRPRHALLLGCERSRAATHTVVQELCRLGHLISAPPS